jgi:pimeloyl-ACP methyl ester carboxylesterase
MAFFETGDHAKLYYETFGQGEKTILFVHGWLDSGESFKKVCGKLAENHRIIVYDQRGHGRSETPDSGFNMTRLATDLRNLIEYLEPENLTLIGYSMGSHVLFEYLKLFGTGGIDKVVITVMSPSLIDEKNPELSLGGMLTWEMAVQRLSMTSRYFEEKLLASYPNYLRTEGPNEAVRKYYEAASKLNSAAMVQLEIAMYAANYWDVLPGIDCPVLVISAERDMYSRAIHEKQAGLMPNAKVVIVPGCGHMMIMERPEAYIDELEAFIDE